VYDGTLNKHIYNFQGKKNSNSYTHMTRKAAPLIIYRTTKQDKRKQVTPQCSSEYTNYTKHTSEMEDNFQHAVSDKQ
jgi:hypothetical protein